MMKYKLQHFCTNFDVKVNENKLIAILFEYLALKQWYLFLMYYSKKTRKKIFYFKISEVFYSFNIIYYSSKQKYDLPQIPIIFK